jgi:hypothetical protein
MQIIECAQEAKHMREPSEDDHEVEYLMAGAVNIMSLGIPSFRNLKLVRFAARTDSQD